MLGGKEGVGHIALACLDPGDVCLAPDPGYPPYTSARCSRVRPSTTCRCARRTASCPISTAAPDAKLLYLNYPNNPTGATAELDFFEHAIQFARERDLIVVHDNAYSEVAFDGYRPPSFLEADGAKEVGVEIFSLSKGWNMTGWRAGLVAGNAEIVERYRQLKTNLDSGMSEAVQHAAAVALTSRAGVPAGDLRGVRAASRPARKRAREVGLEVNVPRATPYFWVAVPEGHTSTSFTELMLEQASVLVSPGDSYGPSGAGYVRLSLTVPGLAARGSR